MDEEILRAILRSSESAVKSLEDVDRKKLDEEDRLTITCNFIFDAVCTSLTNLLCHPVSKEAYQRYSVQLHVIDMLRDWCRIQSDFQHCWCFMNKQRTLELLANLLEKYLTDDILLGNDCDEHLTQLASALIALLPTRPTFEPYLTKLLVRLSRSELPPDAERLLCHVINKNTPLRLDPAMLEEIYVSQSQKFVENPLLNQFQTNCIHEESEENSDGSVVVNTADTSFVSRLLEITADSPRLFFIVCHTLKNLLEYLDYAPAALDYIKFILNIIFDNCRSNKKNVVDLYPNDVQPLVMLLLIEPSEHTEDMRRAVIEKLETLLLKEDSLLILLSHFPEWLEPFHDYRTKHGKSV